MYFIAKSILAAGIATLSVTFSVGAAPMVSVDSANFDMGVIRAGTKKEIKHAFVIKNTGDDTLKIEKVKPG